MVTPFDAHGRVNEEAAVRLKELNHALGELGCLLPAAFHTLGFMGLPVDIGTLKISPKGLIDVWKREVVSLVVG